MCPSLNIATQRILSRFPSFLAEFFSLVATSHGFLCFSFIEFAPILEILTSLPNQTLNSLGEGPAFYSFLYDAKETALDGVKEIRKTY